jgi:hypothetical protein
LFIVELAPKFTPVDVVTLLKTTDPDTVCVAAPEKTTVCVPDAVYVPEPVLVNVVLVTPFTIDNVFVDAVKVPAVPILMLKQTASAVNEVTLWLIATAPILSVVGGTAFAVQVEGVVQLPVAAVVQPL